jgi:hypothetical protein
MTTVDGTPAAPGTPGFGAHVLDWLHEGYPHGVPPKDYFPLLALLLRSLSEDEVIKAAQTVLKQSNGDEPVTEAQIREAIAEVISKDPNPEEINQVAGRLASVGWPLENGHR